MPLRQQYRGHGGCGQGGGRDPERTGCGSRGRLPVYVFRGRTGENRFRYKGKGTDGDCSLFLLPQDARSHLQKGGFPGGFKSLYGGNRQYQGALFLDTQGPGGGHRKGGYPCPGRCIQSESGYASAAGRKPGDKKGPGNRRRDCRHSDRS